MKEEIQARIIAGGTGVLITTTYYAR